MTSTITHEGVKYRKVKRKAKAGELILVVNAYMPVGYKNGDIATVRTYLRNPEYMEIDYGVIFDREYVVLEPVEDDLQAQIDELKAKVRTLEFELVFRKISNSVISFGTALGNELKPKSAQEIRDEVVEQAKEDVKQLIERGSDSTAFGDTDKGSEIYRIYFYAVDLQINRHKRAVTAIVKQANDAGSTAGSMPVVGIAKCAPDDCFNAHIGKAIALRRALELPIPDEYLSVPNPTDVRIGDRVKSNYNGDIHVAESYRPDMDDHGHGKAFRLAGKVTWLGEKQVAIIDDTRE